MAPKAPRRKAQATWRRLKLVSLRDVLKLWEQHDQKERKAGKAAHRRSALGDSLKLLHANKVMKELRRRQLAGRRLKVTPGSMDDQSADEGTYGKRPADGDAWDVYEGMPCDEKAEVMKKMSQQAAMRSFMDTGRDTWAGCKGILDSWTEFEMVEELKTTKRCSAPEWLEDLSFNKEWVNDPCCIYELRWQMCCASRTSTIWKELMTGINVEATSAYAMTDSGSLAIQIARQFSSSELNAATNCFPPFKKAWDSAPKAQDVVNMCFKAVEGTYNEKLGQMVGPKCTADHECFTQSCAKVQSKGGGMAAMSGMGMDSMMGSTPSGGGDGGNGGAGDDKYCKLPLQTASKDFVTPVMRCLIKNSTKALTEHFAITVAQTGDSSASAEVIAKAIMNISNLLEDECRSPRDDVCWRLKTKDKCLSKQACNWAHHASRIECENPCPGGNCTHYCGEEGADAMEQSQFPICSDTESWYGDCDVWGDHDECMKNFCQRKCDANGNDCADYDPTSGMCVYPKLSYHMDKKKECFEDCLGPDGPKPAQAKRCYGKLDSRQSNEETCWNLGIGAIEPVYPEMGWDYDWSLVPPPEYCIVWSFQAVDGKPFTMEPPFGYGCLPRCVMEMDACLHPEECWTWMDAWGKSVSDICADRFEQFRDAFSKCVREAECSGNSCLLVKKGCMESTGLGADPDFRDFNCQSCDPYGEWIDWELKNIECAKGLSDDVCK